MKKRLMTVFVLLLPAFANAGGELATSIQTEGNGLLLVLGIAIMAIMIGSLFGIPYVGYSYAQKMAKKFIENDQDKNAGIKVMGAGILGVIGGVFVVYAFYGTVGSFLDSSAAEINWFKGTQYIASSYVDPMLKTVASGI